MSCMSPTESFFYASIAGVVQKIVDHPFDTVKTKLQVMEFDNGVRNKTLFTFKKILGSKHPIQTFYGGVTPALLAQSFRAATCFSLVQFTCIHGCNSPPEKAPLTYVGIAGSVAGAVESLWMTPLEYIKCQQQTKSNPRSTMVSFLGPLSEFNLHRLTPLFTGFQATLLRETTALFAFFYVYEGVMRYAFPSNREQLVSSLVAGGCAGVAGWLVAFPLDTVKSRQQSGYKGTFSKVLADLYVQEGFRGLYSGFGVTIPRAWISNAVLLATYDFFRKNSDKFRLDI